MVTNYNTQGALFRRILLLVSVLTLAIMLFNDNFANGLQCVILLPIAFLFLSLLNKNVYYKSFDNYGSIFVIIMVFIRYVLTPLFVITSNNATVIENTNRYLLDASLLMTYDIVVIFSGLSYCSNKVKKNNNETTDSYTQKGSLNKIILLLSLFVVTIWFMYPFECSRIFKTIFELNDEEFTMGDTYTTTDSMSGIQRILITLFSVSFAVVRLVLPLKLFTIFKTWNISTNYKLFLSVLLLFAQFFFITGTIVIAIVDILILLLLLTYLYPEKKNILTVSSGIVGVTFVVMFFVARFAIGLGYADTTGSTEYVSRILNAYFTGINNVAAAFRINEPPSFQTFAFSFYNAIPFNNSLFGWHGTSFGDIYSNTIGVTGQIYPTISFGSYYLTPFLAPFFSLIFVYVALSYSVKVNQTNNHWGKLAYLFISFYAASALGCYNSFHAVYYFLNVGIPLIILYKISK